MVGAQVFFQARDGIFGAGAEDVFADGVDFPEVEIADDGVRERQCHLSSPCKSSPRWPLVRTDLGQRVAECDLYARKSWFGFLTRGEGNYRAAKSCLRAKNFSSVSEA